MFFFYFTHTPTHILTLSDASCNMSSNTLLLKCVEIILSSHGLRDHSSIRTQLETRCGHLVGEHYSSVHTWPSLSPPQGKPKPVVTWTKNGEPLDSKRANVRNSDKDSILFIRTSQRDDSGVYEMNVKVDSFEDKSSFIIQIVGESHSNNCKERERDSVCVCVYMYVQVYACVCHLCLCLSPQSCQGLLPA